MALSAEHWEKVKKALGLMARDADLPPTTENCIDCMPVHWETLSDETLLDAYLANKDREIAAAAKLELEKQLVEVNNKLK